MDRNEGRRPKHEISCKVHELQDILAAANQLERFPDCEVKEALKAEIAEYLNPSQSPQTRVSGSLRNVLGEQSISRPAETPPSSKEDEDADWSPEKKKKFFNLPTIAGMLLVALLLFGILRQIF